MEAITSYQIRKLGINNKEHTTKSRRWVGFHAYLSRFFYEFKKLSLQQQHDFLQKNHNVHIGRHTLLNGGDDASIDSTSSRLTEKVSRIIIHRSTCERWKYATSPKIKAAWNKRAALLNKRKVPGMFLVVPPSITRGNNMNIKIMESLSYEWDQIVGFFKNCIMRDPKRSTSSMTYMFGREKVEILSQTYREIRFSFLLENIIFGNNLRNMQKKEIILRTKKQVLLHVSSQKRMKELFLKEELNATEFKNEKYNSCFTHSCCGKINIKNT